jgi:hypothetical protein
MSMCAHGVSPTKCDKNSDEAITSGVSGDARLGRSAMPESPLIGA